MDISMLQSVLMASVLAVLPAHANDDRTHAPEPAVARQSVTPAPSEGVVRKIDAAAGRITLRHGPIANLDMPPMTMVFRIDPTRVQDLKAGDRVRFLAERIDGAYTIVDLHVQP